MHTTELPPRRAAALTRTVIAAKLRIPYLTVAVLVGTVAFAQDKPFKVKGHAIGETAQKAIEVIRARQGDAVNYDCTAISGKDVELEAVYKGKYAWCSFTPDLMARENKGKGLDEMLDNPILYFDRARLVKLSVEVSYRAGVDAVARQFGPGKQTCAPYQNAFGAVWSACKTVWTTPTLYVEIEQGRAFGDGNGYLTVESSLEHHALRSGKPAKGPLD